MCVFLLLARLGTLFKIFKMANVNKVAIMPIEKVYPSVVLCYVSFELYLPKHIFQTKLKLDRAYAWCASPLGILDELTELFVDNRRRGAVRGEREGKC